MTVEVPQNEDIIEEGKNGREKVVDSATRQKRANRASTKR